MIKLKKLIIIFLLTLFIGILPTIFIKTNLDGLITPFEIPKIMFPIVWTILYLLMSITYYVVSNNPNTLKIYLIQLTINSIWTIIFFGLKQRLLSFLWIILLLTIVIIMTIKYYKINNISGYLLIPYIIWLLFAGYLNISIYLLNK